MTREPRPVGRGHRAFAEIEADEELAHGEEEGVRAAPGQTSRQAMSRRAAA